MSFFIVAGVIFAVLGIAGLIVCGVRAARIKRDGGPAEDMRAKLQPLVALNFAALALSMLGLMCVVIGTVLS